MELLRDARRGYVAIIIAVAAGVACGADAPTTPKLDVSGTWVLRTVNGYALPFGQLDNSLLADTLFLQHDGTARRKAVIGYYGAPLVAHVYDGRWTLTDTTFVFTQSEATSFVGTATAQRLAVVGQTDTMPAPGIIVHPVEMAYTR